MMPPSRPKHDFPWWLLLFALIGLVLSYQIWVSPLYTQIMTTLTKGIKITLTVTFVAFFCASFMGLCLAQGAGSGWLIIRQITRFYIELVRGVPIIVLLLYIAFALTPALVFVYNWVESFDWVRAFWGFGPLSARDIPFSWRAVLALSIAYSAFLAEVFRAGIAAVPQGQIEAAMALGLGRWPRFRHIVFPQALRTVLPPLGNDFIAMIKDSSLVSVLGVADITQLGKVTAAGNFKYFETYNIVALIYLTMTIGLSLLLRRLEKWLKQRGDIS